jgi:N-acyl-L-homoserine lactone synthetase
MIIATSIENAHLYGDILPSIFRLRHQGFKQRQNYDVPYFKDMEYDTYDTPATTYLAWRDQDGIVRGCTRLFPTTRPYMIEELWPNSLNTVPLPKSQNVWEASRFCIDKNIPVEIRKKIHGELLCAFHEFGLQNKIDWMIGVMTPPIWRAVFVNAGWPIEYLGDVLELGPRERILTGKMKISRKILQSVQEKFSIFSSVLEPCVYPEQKKRA